MARATSSSEERNIVTVLKHEDYGSIDKRACEQKGNEMWQINHQETKSEEEEDK